MSSLSVLCPTRDPGPRVRAALEPLLTVADEIVVGADSQTDDSDLAEYAAVADRLVRFEHGPLHSTLTWLHAQCHGEWVLLLAGDEVPGPELVTALPELVRSREAVQYRLSLRWLWPDAQRWLAGQPWHPDLQIRLARNDATLRFRGRMHELALPVLPQRVCDLPIWHLDLVLTDEDERRSKVEQYRAVAPGLLAPGGEELNSAYYLPEDAHEPLLEDVPEADAEAIRRVLHATPAAAPAPHDVPLGTRAEIESLWAARTVGEDAFAARVEPFTAAPVRLRPGEHHTLYVRVRNDGDERWPWGLDQPPLVRLGFRWLPDGPEGRAAFPCDVPPGEARIVAVPVVAPAANGLHTLELRVLLEDVRWFGEPTRLEVVVT